MSALTDPGDIVAQFFSHAFNPKQSQIDRLLGMGVSIQALANDTDGQGLAIGVARVEKCGRRFEFVEDGANAVVVVARDEEGTAADLVAWMPNEGWFGPWLDTLPLLGMHNLFAPRLGDPLPAFLDPADWFRADRDGVVILNRQHAWRLLEGVTVAASTVEDGVKLRKVLETPKPKIVVRALPEVKAAA